MSKSIDNKVQGVVNPASPVEKFQYYCAAGIIYMGLTPIVKSADPELAMHPVTYAATTLLVACLGGRELIRQHESTLPYRNTSINS